MDQQESIWLYKQAACLRALNIADSRLSNYQYSNLKAGDIVPSKKPTEEDVRICINQLIVSCQKSDVLAIFKKILGLYGPISLDIILDLRYAVRKELGFKKEKIENDRKKAFIAKINYSCSEPPEQKLDLISKECLICGDKKTIKGCFTKHKDVCNVCVLMISKKIIIANS